MIVLAKYDLLPPDLREVYYAMSQIFHSHVEVPIKANPKTLYFRKWIYTTSILVVLRKKGPMLLIDLKRDLVLLAQLGIIIPRYHDIENLAWAIVDIPGYIQHTKPDYLVRDTMAELN